MQVAILGAGALGSILAAHLTRSGHDVTVLARGRRAAQLDTQGLRISGLAALDARCRVLTDPTALPACDVLVVAVKTYALADAVAPLADAAVGVVFSVANGVLATEQLAGTFGSARVLGCMADVSGELLASGEVRFTRNVNLHLGERGPGRPGRAAPLAAAFHDAGINARAVDDIDTIQWSKFVGWVALMALAVLTRADTGRFLADPDVAAIAADVIHEMAALAARRGIPLIDQSPVPVASIAAADGDGAVRLVQALGDTFARLAPGHRMSSLQDLEAGRPLEVHETLGHARTLARDAGVVTPTLDVLYRLVSAVDPARRAASPPPPAPPDPRERRDRERR